MWHNPSQIFYFTLRFDLTVFIYIPVNKYIEANSQYNSKKCAPKLWKENGDKQPDLRGQQAVKVYEGIPEMKYVYHCLKGDWFYHIIKVN